MKRVLLNGGEFNGRLVEVEDGAKFHTLTERLRGRERTQTYVPCDPNMGKTLTNADGVELWRISDRHATYDVKPRNPGRPEGETTTHRPGKPR